MKGGFSCPCLDAGGIYWRFFSHDNHYPHVPFGLARMQVEFVLEEFKNKCCRGQASAVVRMVAEIGIASHLSSRWTGTDASWPAGLQAFNRSGYEQMCVLFWGPALELAHMESTAGELSKMAAWPDNVHMRPMRQGLCGETEDHAERGQFMYVVVGTGSLPEPTCSPINFLK